MKSLYDSFKKSNDTIYVNLITAVMNLGTMIALMILFLWGKGALSEYDFNKTLIQMMAFLFLSSFSIVANSIAHIVWLEKN